MLGIQRDHNTDFSLEEPALARKIDHQQIVTTQCDKWYEHMTYEQSAMEVKGEGHSSAQETRGGERGKRKYIALVL